jgi:Domain of unknown function (DUF4384)
MGTAIPTATIMAAVLLAAIGGGASGDDPPTGAKEIFFDPSQTYGDGPPPSKPAPDQSHHDSSGRRTPRPVDPAATRSLGLSYWIELYGTSNAAMKPVTDAHTFRSGDRIRLHFRSNADGRILLIQLGSSGTANVLFPDPEKGVSDNGLHAGEDAILPAPGRWFKFDSSSGTERLLVLFARSQEEIEHSFHPRPYMSAAETVLIRQAAHHRTGAKDLMIETETEEVAEVGTYAVSVSGKPMVLEIALQHR